ncbi:protein-(glutamine-N5) methyltransferase, release factor-specific, partial [Vibrio parahaemolyticus VP2007-007]
QNPRWSLMKMA